jgi:mono/diheme cytochrome c family protein
LPLLMGDAVRGQSLFRSQGCVGCHSVNGAGGKTAADLGLRGGRGFSPSAMAALLWNHGPRMWATMTIQGAARPEFGEQQAADLFAYFYAARYFDPPGDARRGSDLFTEKRCAACHKGPGPGPGGARPVSTWQSTENPIALAQHLWNHSAEMHLAMAQKKIPYPELAAEDLTDLVAYARRLQRTPGRLSQPDVGSALIGQQYFTAKRCAACHTGDFDLRTRRTRFSLTDFAASLWNHAPGMPGNRPILTYDEMRHLVAYLGALQYFEEYGNIDRGQEVFQKKKCAACHGDSASGAPDLSSKAGSISSYQMVAALWRHGPAMLEAMNRRRLPWPQFTAGEMADLVAFLHGPRLKRR